MKHLINLLFILFLTFSVAQAAVITAVPAGGAWNAAGTWDAGVPSAGDIVIIPDNTTVTLSANMTTAIATLTIQSGGVLNGNNNDIDGVTGDITIDAGGTLTNVNQLINLTGNILNNGGFSTNSDIQTSGTITNNGTSFSAGADVFTSGFYNTTPATISEELKFVAQAVCCGELFNNSSTLTATKVNGDLDTYPIPVGLSAPGSYYTYENSGHINILDKLQIDGYFTNTATGTIDATGNQIHVDGYFCNQNTFYQSIKVDILKIHGGEVGCGGSWQVEEIKFDENDLQTGTSQPGTLQSFYFCKADGTPPTLTPKNDFPTDAIIDSAHVSFCGVILPVILIEFKGELIEHDINIQWTTSSELHNSYFELMYSQKGYEFEIIGTILGNGSTNQTSNYNFIHRPNEGQWAYYRLKQVDFDGVYENSKTISVKRNNSTRTDYITVSPNPVIDNLVMEYHITNYEQKMSFQIWNSQGILIKTISISGNSGIKKINLSNLKSGIYLLSLPNGKSRKLLKR